MEPQLLSGISDAGSFAELARALDAGVLRLGFRYFAFFGVFAAAATGEYPIHFDNCPRGWTAFYRGYSFAADEPRFDPYDAREVTPILWRQLAPAAPAFFEEAQKFGLVTGCAHPVHGPEGQRSVLTYIKDRGGAEAEAEIDAALASCQLLAGYVHRAAARLAGLPRAASPLSAPSRLNERERQVLTRVAAGMTASQIAAELPISRRTVIFHLSNARRKLGAANSSHAISMALSLGLIRATQRDVPPPGRSLRGVETCYFERRPSPNAKPTSLMKSTRSAGV